MSRDLTRRLREFGSHVRRAAHSRGSRQSRGAPVALLVGLAGAVILVAGISPRAQTPTLKYTTSWIGNSYGGRDGRWVQDWVQGMAVAPDGTVYTNAFWDEGGREVGVYRNGQVIGSAGHTHGWGLTGGSAICFNSKYLFICQSVNSEGGHLVDPDTWPEKGNVWIGVSRRLRSDPQKAAPFPDGKGGKGDTLKGGFLVVEEAPEKTEATIAGLAATESRLYLSDPYTRRILAYSAETMVRTYAWQVDRLGPLAAAADGTLWAIQQPEAREPARLLHFTPSGVRLPDSITLPGNVRPTALCLRGPRLLIADDGPEQQIKVYDPRRAPQQLVGTLGAKGGVLSGTPGAVGPFRFHDLSGVGVDRAGNVYVASGFGRAGDGVGTEMECYTPAGKRLWRLLGLLFVDSAESDPSDESDLFAKHERFVLDYSRRAPGSEWSYRGFTLDRFRYPEDPRLHAYPTTVWVRRVHGQRLLYMVDMYSACLAIYRFSPKTEGEIAIPCGYFAKEHVKPQSNAAPWPPNQPDKGEWIWHDKNGNGAFDSGEFDSAPADAPPLWGWWVDERGDVWQATEKEGIRRFPLQGLDSHGRPIYSCLSMVRMPTPPLFNDLQRAQYDADTDTMYLAGYTDAYPNDHGYWKVIGRVLAAYPRWSTGSRNPLWVKTVSHEEKGETVMPASFTVAGDYVFTVEVKNAQVEVYNRRTGAHVGSMAPGPEVDRKSGWVDVPYGISAHRRANGEYIILVEEDWLGKNLMYRWTLEKSPREAEGNDKRRAAAGDGRGPGAGSGRCARPGQV